MVKKGARTRYLYDGELLSATEIYKRNKKRHWRSKYLLSAIIELTDNERSKSVPAKLVFVRNRNKKKYYLVLISTDQSLPEEEIIRIYGKRWSIEVFFKMCKSYLKLTGECRSLSYDAMTAYVAIVFARYMMLAPENRVRTDERTFGELFYEVCDELPDITWEEAFRILMKLLAASTTEKLFLTEDELETIIENFLRTLPKAFKVKGAKMRVNGSLCLSVIDLSWCKLY
jgi:hypothetical protein